MDVFPALLDGDVPFYSHEIDAYWNDIGNLDELHSGNFDALAGAVKLEPAGELADDGDERFDGPVLLGEDAEIDPEAKITGPAVIGPALPGRRRGDAEGSRGAGGHRGAGGGRGCGRDPFDAGSRALH